MRSCGVSRQKARYIRSLAADVRDRRFDLNELGSLNDDQVRDRITARLGLGSWSADVYLMMALGRPDVLPIGDLALVKGMSELDGGNYPDAQSVRQRAGIWRPYRSMATKLVWSLYLDNRNKKAIQS